MQFPETDFAGRFEGGRPQVAAFEVPSSAPWIVRLMLGTPRFPATKFEYFGLGIIRAMIAPVAVLIVPCVLLYMAFGRAALESIPWAILSILVHAFFEEHARLTFARAVGSLLGGALLFSLGIGLFEFLVMMPLADEIAAPVELWKYYGIVRGICLGMHLACGLVVGLAARKGDARSIVAGLSVATVGHALFNLYGVSALVANWLVGA
jgi:hypothetical protein